MHLDHRQKTSCQPGQRLLSIFYNNKNHNRDIAMIKTFKMSKHLPWAPDDVFRLLMDVEAFPEIHPEVRTARTAWVRPGYRDVEIDFNKAAGVILQGQALGLRVTSVPPQQIEVIRTKGQIEQLKMNWRLNPDGEGGTDMDFSLSYQTGQGDLVDSGAFSLVKKMVGEILSRFESYAATRLVPGQEASAEPEAVVTRRTRRSGHQPS